MKRHFLILAAFVAVFGYALIHMPGCGARHHVKKVVTKDHHIFLHQLDTNDWFEFIVPDTGNSQPYWSRVPSGPKTEEVEQEEDATVEENDSGMPEGDVSDGGGDAGGDSGDSGGDGGGGDGGE